jgi:hypothetical protein
MGKFNIEIELYEPNSVTLKMKAAHSTEISEQIYYTAQNNNNNNNNNNNKEDYRLSNTSHKSLKTKCHIPDVVQ